MTALTTALIGQTEKMLNLLLHQNLDGTELSESEWVTLRIADHLAIAHFNDDLATAVQDRAGFEDASALVSRLSARGLIDNDRVSETGRDLVDAVQRRIETSTATLWAGISEENLETTNRVLREALNQARVALGREPLGPPKR